MCVGLSLNPYFCHPMCVGLSLKVLAEPPTVTIEGRPLNCVTGEGWGLRV